MVSHLFNRRDAGSVALVVKENWGVPEEEAFALMQENIPEAPNTVHYTPIYRALFQ
jgi:hypothetical protein